jgi:hypothetical protein
MRALRSFLSWMLALEAVICWLNVPREALRSLYALQAQGMGASGGMIVTALPMILGGAIFTLLCLAYWRKWQSARVWAIAAGITNLLFTAGILAAVWLPGHRRGSAPSGLWQMIGLPLALGIGTIVAFWRWNRDEERKAAGKPERIAGDGTHPLLDKLAWVFGFVGFVAGMGWWWHWARTLHLPQNAGLGYWPEVVIAELAMVLLHEMGHALTGTALGMRLRAFIVGPFQWRIRDGNWRFQFRLTDFLATGGATAVVPADSHQSPRREIWMIAGGPAASLLGGLLALAALLTAPGHSWAGEWRLLALFATFCLLAAIINLLPLRTPDSYSDGAQIYQLLAGGPWADYHRVLATVGSSTVTRLRPRDVDLKAMERAATVMTKGRRGTHLRLLEYCCCLDRGDLREASCALNSAEELALAAEREIPVEFYADFVFGKAFVQRDAEGTRAWWARIEAKKTHRLNADYWLAQAASLWMDGKMTEAKEAWEKGNALAQRLPRAGAYDAQRDKFAMLRRELDAERRVPRWHDDLVLTTHGGG